MEEAFGLWVCEVDLVEVGLGELDSGFFTGEEGFADGEDLGRWVWGG